MACYRVTFTSLYLYIYRTNQIFSIAPKELLSQVYLLLLSVYLILIQLVGGGRRVVS